MKILFLAQLPPPINGSTIVSQDIFRYLNDRENIKKINISSSKDLKDYGKINISKLFIILNIYWQLITSLVFNKFDCLYLTFSPKGTGFFKDLTILFLCSFFIKRKIIHIHGVGMKNYIMNSRYRKIINFLTTFAFKNSEIIHAGKRKLHPEFYDLPIKKCHIIANPIDENVKNFKTKKIYDFVYFSNIFEKKGIFVFLESLHLLKKKNKDFKVLIIGLFRDAENREKFNNLITKYKLKSNINYIGPIYGKKKFFYLSKAKVFVFPSFEEAFGLVVLEAMSISLPIIGTNVGSVNEMINSKKLKCGILIKPNDKLSLFKALLLMYKNETLINMLGKNSRQKYIEKYSPQITRKKIYRVFNPN